MLALQYLSNKAIDHSATLTQKGDAYTDIKELTPEILRTFISKIVIHERSRKHAKDAEQDIDIYFTHIGNLNRFSFDRQIPPNEITA